MRETDAVWRTLADAALQGNREWKNTADLAWAAGVGDKIAYKAMQRPTSIGAVARHPAGGFSVTDPERIVTMLAAARSLSTARHTTLDAVQKLMTGADLYAIGGTRAAAHHLGGRNTDLADRPADDEAIAVTIDRHTLESWRDGFTSAAQTYADLFAQPGWQASEFRRALWRRWFSVDDWAIAEASRG